MDKKVVGMVPLSGYVAEMMALMAEGKVPTEEQVGTVLARAASEVARCLLNAMMGTLVARLSDEGHCDCDVCRERIKAEVTKPS